MEKAELTALIVKAQAGDQGAMEEVLRTAHTSVSYQCRKLLRDPRDAEDMTQEVLLTVYTRLDTLKTPEAFWGWLNQTTANRCVNAMKRNRVEFQFAEDEEGHSVLDDLEEMDEQQVPDKALDNTETTRMIEEIVDGLPDAQRVCTLMYYYDEMSVKDIAAALGVPENTVKSRLNYARKAVKERVLDYEKKGVKLYGLSPLPFMLYFLLHAAEESADSAAADIMAKKVVELGAAAVAGGTAAGGAAAGGATAAGGGAAAAAGGAAAKGISAKLIAGALAGLLAVGGVAAAVAVVSRDDPGPTAAVTETLPPETEHPPEETAAPEPTETPLVEEPIPAERLALLSSIAYYGDPAQCRMTVDQARAYAEAIEARAAESTPTKEYELGDCFAALIDIGEGDPVLVMTRGPIHGGYAISGDPGPDFVAPSNLCTLDGKLEVWRYVDGQAELVAAGHEMRWKPGAGFVCQTRVESVWDENGEMLPDADFSHCLDYTEDAYSVEGGVLSATPVSSAYAEVDWGTWMAIGGTIDGRPVGEAEWQAIWEQRWGNRYQDDWMTLGTGYDSTIGGPVDEGVLNIDTVSPGADAAAVLRQCAGE